MHEEEEEAAASCDHGGCGVCEDIGYRVFADMALKTEPNRYKIVMCGSSSRGESVPFDEKPSIGTQRREKTKKPTLLVKKKSTAISPAVKSVANKRSNQSPVKEIDKRKKPVKLEKVFANDLDPVSNGAFYHILEPIKSEDKVSVDKMAENVILAVDEIAKAMSPSISSTKKEIVRCDDDDSPHSRLVNQPNRRVVKRLKPGTRRKVPKSSVMTIWHWLSERSGYTPTSTEGSTSQYHRVEDPFLSLFVPAMTATWND